MRVLSRLAPFRFTRHAWKSVTLLWHPVCMFLVILGALLGFAAPPCHAQSETVASPSTPPPAPQLKADLQRILKGPEFQPETSEPSALTKMLRNLRGGWERLRKWFQDLFRAGSLKAGGTTLIWILVILMGSGLAWIAFRLLREWRPARATENNIRLERTALEEEPEDIIRDPEHWHTQAEQYAQSGNYRQAYRALFLAVLLKLDAGGALSFGRARTNGDYIRQLRGGSSRSLYDLLLPPAHAFDRFWYGQEAAQQEDYHALHKTYKRLNALLAPVPPLGEQANDNAPKQAVKEPAA